MVAVPRYAWTFLASAPFSVANNFGRRAWVAKRTTDKAAVMACGDSNMLFPWVSSNTSPP